MPKTKLSVEQEILKATGAKPRGKKESIQEYLDRVARGVDAWCKEAGDADAADARYETLSEEAQGWQEAAGEAINDKKDIPEFPSAGGASPPAEPQPQEGEKEKPVKTKKEKKGLKKAPKEKKAKAPRGPGRHEIFRERVIAAYLKGDGGRVKFGPIYDAYVEKVGESNAITKPSASVVASNTLQTLAILDRNGNLKR